jgi:molybdopterin molybdotransferase
MTAPTPHGVRVHRSNPLTMRLADLLAFAEPLTGAEQVATFDADGRVLANALVSALQVPPHDNSSMDGYALRQADLEAGLALPVSQRIAAAAVVHHWHR